jgi:hypothetical protein
MIKMIHPLRILSIFHQEITYECIHAFYATADADEDEIILQEKGTVEIEYEDDFVDGDD